MDELAQGYASTADTTYAGGLVPRYQNKGAIRIGFGKRGGGGAGRGEICQNGHPNPPGNKFCTECGIPLSGASKEAARASIEQYGNVRMGPRPENFGGPTTVVGRSMQGLMSAGDRRSTMPGRNWASGYIPRYAVTMQALKGMTTPEQQKRSAANLKIKTGKDDLRQQLEAGDQSAAIISHKDIGGAGMLVPDQIGRKDASFTEKSAGGSVTFPVYGLAEPDMHKALGANITAAQNDALKGVINSAGKMASGMLPGGMKGIGEGELLKRASKIEEFRVQ